MRAHGDCEYREKAVLIHSLKVARRVCVLTKYRALETGFVAGAAPRNFARDNTSMIAGVHIAAPQ